MWTYGKTLREVSDCTHCGTRQGCRQNDTTPTPVPWALILCYRCYGEDAECEICGGMNKVQMTTCPRALVKPEHTGLLPYYLHFANSGHVQYPDGAGIAYQPVILRQAFDVFNRYIDRRDEIKAEK